MAVIIDISVAADQFALGSLLSEYPNIDIELEKVVPLRGGIIPLFWVEGGDEDDIEATLRADPIVKDVRRLTEADGRMLFEAVWQPEVDALVQPLINSGAEVLVGEGSADRWTFRLQFRDRDQLSAFRDALQANDVTFDLEALYNPVLPDAGEHGPLTAEQEDILLTALDHGYWDIPRGVTIQALADHVGLSDTAVSQRLRRGTKAVMEATVAHRNWPL